MRKRDYLRRSEDQPRLRQRDGENQGGVHPLAVEQVRAANPRPSDQKKWRKLYFTG